MLDWLPVSETVSEFLSQLVYYLKEYPVHMHKVNLRHRVKKRGEQYFLIEPAVNSKRTEENKGNVFQQVYFSSIIHVTRAHDLTCSIPDMHQYDVHYLTLDPNLVPDKQTKKKTLDWENDEQ